MGGSVASAVTGSGAAAGTGLMGMIGAVQFAAATSDMCGVQSQPILLDVLSIMQSLNMFNLRIPMPDFGEMPDLAFIEKLPLKEAISMCGVTDDTSLEGQARSEIGDLFTTNVFVSAFSLLVVVSIHFLVLALTPRRWSARVTRVFPFMQIELILYLTANQGLIISATQLMGIAGDNGVCFFAGLVVLMVPTLFLVFVSYLLFWYVRPSSRAAKVRWNDEEGEWVLAKKRPGNEQGNEKEDSAEEPNEVARARTRLKPRSRHKSEGWAEAASDSGDHKEAGQDDAKHDSNVDGMRRSMSGRLVHSTHRLVRSVTSRALETVKSDFHVLYEPLFEGWHGKRLAWVGPALLLAVEYGLGLAMGFGALASCEAEQVPLRLVVVCRSNSAASCLSPVGLQVSNTLTVAVYLLFLILSRPYDDTIFQTYELITSAGQLAMMIIIMVGYFELVEAPQGAFIGVIVFILMGQIGNQVLSDGMSMSAHHIVKRSLSRKGWSQASSFCSCRNSPTRGSWSGSSLPTSCLCASQHTVMCRKKSWAAS
jgi:hypothetical protein